MTCFMRLVSPNEKLAHSTAVEPDGRNHRQCRFTVRDPPVNVPVELTVDVARCALRTLYPAAETVPQELRQIAKRRKAGGALAHPRDGPVRIGRFVEDLRQADGVRGNREDQRVRPILRGERGLPGPHRFDASAQDHDARRRERFLERGDERRVTARIALHRLMVELDRALRGREIARLADEMAEPLQGERRDAVPGGCGAVMAGLGPMDQRLVVIAHEEESAVLAVLEALEEEVGDRARELEIVRAEIAFA